MAQSVKRLPVKPKISGSNPTQADDWSLRCVLTCPSPCFIDTGYVKWKTIHPSDRTLNGGPVYRKVTPLHVKNPLHYSYKSRRKPRCSGPPAYPNQAKYMASARIFSIEGGRMADYLEEEEKNKWIGFLLIYNIEIEDFSTKSHTVLFLQYIAIGLNT